MTRRGSVATCRPRDRTSRRRAPATTGPAIRRRCADAAPRRLRLGVRRARRGELAGHLPLHAKDPRACRRCRSGASGSGTAGCATTPAGIRSSPTRATATRPASSRPWPSSPATRCWCGRSAGSWTTPAGRHRAHRGVRGGGAGGLPRLVPRPARPAGGHHRAAVPRPVSLRLLPVRRHVRRRAVPAVRAAGVPGLRSATTWSWPDWRGPRRRPPGWWAWRWSWRWWWGCWNSAGSSPGAPTRAHLHLGRLHPRRRLGAAVGLGAGSLVALPVEPFRRPAPVLDRAGELGPAVGPDDLDQAGLLRHPLPPPRPVLLPGPGHPGAVRAGGVATIPAVVRRFGWRYGAYVGVLVLVPAVGSQDFQGLGRYLLGAFPRSRWPGPCWPSGRASAAGCSRCRPWSW